MIFFWYNGALHNKELKQNKAGKCDPIHVLDKKLNRASRRIIKTVHSQRKRNRKIG